MGVLFSLYCPKNLVIHKYIKSTCYALGTEERMVNQKNIVTVHMELTISLTLSLGGKS